ncbi:MAG: response regulator transcription factor [Gemmatimonadaceae bacterium]|nr:response regulator transcription factor [Gemmatimonadaceae bacterium]
MSHAIRVVVVDDHAIVREGVRTVLEGEPGFEIVGEGASVSEAIAQAIALAPDVLILDITMPDGSGLQAVPEVLERSPATHVLVLSVHDNLEYVLESVRVGAHGYLRKDSAPAELRAAVRAVHSGELFMTPEIRRRVATALTEPQAAPVVEPPPHVLTPREREVLFAVAQGLANKEIAARLGISRRTVEAHRDSLSRKLGIRTVAGLTRYCLKHGLLSG